MLDMMQIGRKLSELRNKHNLTQEDISQRLYVTHQAVSKWETGKALPNIDNLSELSALYKVSLDELLCLDVALGNQSVESLFKTHARNWVIHEVVLGNVLHLGLEDIIHLLDKDEREYALYLLIESSIPIDENLWPRLSIEERFRLINQYIARGYPLKIEKILPLMSYTEKRKIKEEKNENC